LLSFRLPPWAGARARAVRRTSEVMELPELCVIDTDCYIAKTMEN